MIEKTERPLVICLTPVKNESWILDRFIQCAGLWADQIIIADQNSDDDSVEIAKKYEKVTVVHNPPEKYFNEYSMRKVLFDEARKIPGKKLLIAVDADEALSANLLQSNEWETVLNSKPGTIIKFQLINIRPYFNFCWQTNSPFARGFMDDGTEYKSEKIHTNHIPISPDSSGLILTEIKLLHFQYIDWERMQSKHRWYQCWERINKPKKNSTEIFRQYHHMYSIKPSELMPVQKEWLDLYQQNKIDVTSANQGKEYWWDKIVLEYMNEYGSKYFNKEDIWLIDWVEKANKYGYSDLSKFKDHRTSFIILIGHYRRRTQMYYKSIIVRIIDKLIKYIFRI